MGSLRLCVYGPHAPPEAAGGGPSSGEMPAHLSAAAISSAAPGTSRDWSVSSMRRMKLPLCLRANTWQKRAVRRPPRCRDPVGEGAKRVRMGAVVSLLLLHVLLVVVVLMLLL